MLQSLAIRDVVLIESLDLAFPRGLCVLTGETGAGKSILLDALGLALGARAERGLVRQGAAQAAVTAVFALPADHPTAGLLDQSGIAREDVLMLRRVLAVDGRSRAFVNDQPVSGTLLRRIGAELVEVHGQHDQVGLSSTSTHRALLDAHGRLQAELEQLRALHSDWRAAEERRALAEAELRRLREEESWLVHLRDELRELDVQPGEEEALAERRTRLQHRERLAEAIDLALRETGDALERTAGIERRITRVAGMAEELLAPAHGAIERALVELAEAQGQFETVLRAIEEGEQRIESVEERLFALRAAGRKHRCAVDALPVLLADTEARLAAIDDGDVRLGDHAERAAAARAAFRAQAGALSAGRAAAAEALAAAVSTELAPLKLERARFRVALDALAEDAIGAEGAERVAFEIATNPGQPFGPLARIASGGELARLMLALKVVLARAGSTPTVIFDEIDSGIGGATADAVGERLARLGRELQVLVVTHAPQVAARADHHVRIAKQLRRGSARVEAHALSLVERREEVARMLAGAEITPAARAAAESLLGQAS